MSEKSIVETMAASIGREAAVLKAKKRILAILWKFDDHDARAIVSAVAAAVVGEGA